MANTLSFAAAAVAVAALSACTGTAEIAPVVVDAGQGLPRIAGSYAAQVQGGGWALKTEPGSFTCSAWSFDTDVNGPFEAAMRQALTDNLESVRFVGETLSADDIAAQGLDGQVIVYQGNATSDFGVQNNFFTGTAQASMTLETIVAIVTANGLSFQRTVSGGGRGAEEVFTCDTIGKAIGAAASEAIHEVVEDSILYIREGLRSAREAAAPPTS